MLSLLLLVAACLSQAALSGISASMSVSVVQNIQTAPAYTPVLRHSFSSSQALASNQTVINDVHNDNVNHQYKNSTNSHIQGKLTQSLPASATVSGSVNNVIKQEIENNSKRPEATIRDSVFFNFTGAATLTASFTKTEFEGSGHYDLLVDNVAYLANATSNNSLNINLGAGNHVVVLRVSNYSLGCVDDNRSELDYNLTAKVSQVNAVPEPATCALLAIAGPLLLKRRKRSA